MNSTTRIRAVRAVAPVAGLLAAGLLVWQGSYAAFSATTDNTDDAWSTGTMVLKNNGGTATFAGTTAALFTEGNLNFGATGQKCITVESSGTLGGGLSLYRGTVTGTDKLGAASTALAPQVKVSVDAFTLASSATNVAADCVNFPLTGSTSLTSNTALSALPSTYGTGLAVTVPDSATTRVAYRISWTLQSTGLTSTDNVLQGHTVKANLNWELQPA